MMQGIATVDLGTLLDAGDGAVVTLVTGDTQLAAHRAVLAARSPVFAAMFSHDTLEASSGRVEIPDVEGPVLRQLLSYCYSLRAPQLPAMAAQLLAAADKYGVLGLKDECEQRLSAQLAVETAAATAVLAVRHSCPSLEEAAVAFIKANSEVFATQGWADAVRTRPEEVVRFSRLLAEPPAETSAPATKRRRPSPRARPQSYHDQTAVAAAPLEALHPTPPPEDSAASSSQSIPERIDMMIRAAEAGMNASVGPGTTALLWAAKEGREDVVRRLVEAGVDVNARDISQNTPLYWAAKNGHESVVRLLVASAADPNAGNVDGTTPLHWAAINGHRGVVVTLLEAGANREVRDSSGNTPLEDARSNGYYLLEELLM